MTRDGLMPQRVAHTGLETDSLAGGLGG
jgi:hypothetical protein